MNLISRRIEFWLPPFLLLCGFLLRAEYLREYAQLLNFDVPAGPDVMEYDLRAREILKGRLFPAVPDIHAPLYPLFLVLVYYAGNFALLPVRILQLLFNFTAWIFLEKLLDRKGFDFKTRMCFLFFSMFYPVAFFSSDRNYFRIPAPAVSDRSLVAVGIGRYGIQSEKTPAAYARCRFCSRTCRNHPPADFIRLGSYFPL